jgi:outer membrane autotransporter protein
MSMINNSIGAMNVPEFNLVGNTNLSVDVDLANEKMDRIQAGTYNINNGATLNVIHLNLLSDATKDKTQILLAEEDLAPVVKYTGATPVAYSPIYKYDVMYAQNSEDNLGYFHFTRSGVATKNKSDSFNPAVLPTSVSTSAGAYTTQLQTFNYAFQNSENFMSIPYLERISIRNQNKYALSSTGDATDVGRFLPLFQKDHEYNGYWVKPYVSFESIPLKNGPKVSNINYGTMIGYDTDMVSLKHGWDRVLTGYVGYNGASQRYSGIDTYQNGGLIGGTATFYKGNFFNATTLSVGASAGHTTTMYGNEDYAMLLSGIANKAGYNFEFQGGRYIIQPSMLMSYTFVNTFDYTNAAGVKIDSDPLHAIQLAPGVRFIMNTENGWQPYIGASMVWNVLDKQKVMANDVRLPEMSIKPYVEYGLGIQKCFKEDKFTAFGQAMMHNGGRNGIALSLGLRWKVGRTEK